MATKADLVDAANRSFIGSFQVLAAHTGEFRVTGGVVAFATGLDSSLFNGCIVSGPAEPAALEEAVRWTASRASAFRVWIDEGRTTGLGAQLAAMGLARDLEPYPAMVLHPIPVPPPPAVGVTVVRVTPATLDEHVAMRIADGTPPEMARKLYAGGFADDPAVRLFTAYLEGMPVGGSVAIRNGDVGGVYAVGTQSSARRRGVGTAATWACVSAARTWGCETVTLQASPMGLPIYLGMGFRTVVAYAVYRRST